MPPASGAAARAGQVLAGDGQAAGQRGRECSRRRGHSHGPTTDQGIMCRETNLPVCCAQRRVHGRAQGVKIGFPGRPWRESRVALVPARCGASATPAMRCWSSAARAAGASSRTTRPTRRPARAVAGRRGAVSRTPISCSRCSRPDRSREIALLRAGHSAGRRCWTRSATPERMRAAGRAAASPASAWMRMPAHHPRAEHGRALLDEHGRRLSGRAAGARHCWASSSRC